MSATTEPARSYRGEDDQMRVVDKVAVTIHLDKADADRLAQHRADRLASALDVLADESKELARPIMDALIAAGYGE